MPSRISGACNACRAKKQKVSGTFPPPYYRLTFHSAVEIDQAALSVELPTKYAPGQHKGNGKHFPSSMPKLQYADSNVQGTCEGIHRRIGASPKRDRKSPASIASSRS